MKNLKCSRFLVLVALFTIGLFQNVNSQEGEFNDLERALKFPDKVTRLDLSNKNITSLPQEISLFKNLTYLSLRNNHLEFLPVELSSLTKLKVLDLGENLFRTLPTGFSGLTSLEELYLDNDKNLDLEANMDVLVSLSSLRILKVDTFYDFQPYMGLWKLRNEKDLHLNKSLVRYSAREISLLDNLRQIDFREHHIRDTHPRTHEMNIGVRFWK